MAEAAVAEAVVILSGRALCKLLYSFDLSAPCMSSARRNARALDCSRGHHPCFFSDRPE